MTQARHTFDHQQENYPAGINLSKAHSIIPSRSSRIQHRADISTSTGATSALPGHLKQTIPTNRPNRISKRITVDSTPTKSYGSPIRQEKPARSLRVFYQNIKGLSHKMNSDDHDYYLSQFCDLNIDVAGLSETNTAWQHSFLRHEFTNRARRAGEGMSKTSFGSPSVEVDPIPPTETFQAGGVLTTCIGQWTTSIYGPEDRKSVV